MPTAAAFVVFAFVAAARAGPPDYGPPLVITRGGTYTGDYRSDDPATPAITVRTDEPVEIAGCRTLSRGIHIKAPGGTRLNFHHNTFTGLPPVGDGQWARVLDDYHPQTLVFEHNTVDHTGGLLIDHSGGRTPRVVIRYNRFLNTDKRKADGTAGEHRAAVLFNTVLPVEAEIAWNAFENEPGKSHVEDNINLYNSGGRAGSPVRVHDNLIVGAYPFPLSAERYTGSGITVEGTPDHKRFEDVSQHIEIADNVVLSTCNAAINVNAGHDIRVRGNTAVSAGVYPDGSPGGFFYAGVSVWNGSKAGPAVFRDITVEGNTIGYVRRGRNVASGKRYDTDVGVDLAKNVRLPDPVTLDTERQQRATWYARAAAAGLSIGNPAK